MCAALFTVAREPHLRRALGTCSQVARRRGRTERPRDRATRRLRRERPARSRSSPTTSARSAAWSASLAELALGPSTAGSCGHRDRLCVRAARGLGRHLPSGSRPEPTVRAELSVVHAGGHARRAKVAARRGAGDGRDHAQPRRLRSQFSTASRSARPTPSRSTLPFRLNAKVAGLLGRIAERRVLSPQPTLAVRVRLGGSRGRDTRVLPPAGGSCDRDSQRGRRRCLRPGRARPGGERLARRARDPPRVGSWRSSSAVSGSARVSSR